MATSKKVTKTAKVTKTTEEVPLKAKAPVETAVKASEKAPAPKVSVSKPLVKTVSKPAKAKNASVPPVAHGVGRRKGSIARVWMYRGGGDVLVNGKKLVQYFDTDASRLEAGLPLAVAPHANQYRFVIDVIGGGKSGQAGAVKVGLARALTAADESIKSLLRGHGLLTVDSRVKERKKYGRKGARRAFQFVKR